MLEYLVEFHWALYEARGLWGMNLCRRCCLLFLYRKTSKCQSLLFWSIQWHPRKTSNYNGNINVISIPNSLTNATTIIGYCNMSTPAEYYNSLPPVSKAYGVACLMTTAANYLQLYSHRTIALFYEDVVKGFQIWRLITNFFFLGSFSFPFAFRLIIIAKYGVSLEKGPFDKRTADFVWMFLFGALSLLVMAAIPMLWSPFMGASLVFMIVYIWGREFPNARINIYGVVSLKGFYLPWAMLALDLIFGAPLKPDILGMVAGHLYYFLTVLHPLSGGKFILKTPFWVHKLVAFWGRGTQINAPVQPDPSAGIAFRGRSFRLNGTRTTNSTEEAEASNPVQQQANNSADGVAFRGRSYRLGGQ